MVTKRPEDISFIFKRTGSAPNEKIDAESAFGLNAHLTLLIVVVEFFRDQMRYFE